MIKYIVLRKRIQKLKFHNFITLLEKYLKLNHFKKSYKESKIFKLFYLFCNFFFHFILEIWLVHHC